MGEIVVDDGQLRFIDRTTTPVYSEEISRLAVTVTGLTTATDGRAEVALQGVIGGSGALDLKGHVTPRGDPFSLELEGELREFPLPRTNPIFRRFFDRFVERGSLTSKVHYRIVGDQLEAANRVHVQRLDVERDPAPVKTDRKIGLPLGLIAAAVLFMQELPGVPVPDSAEKIVDRLRERAPTPEASARELRARRLKTARQLLVERGMTEVDRVQASAEPVELGASGRGRVEFELR